jgi:hypothetical protein
LFVHATSTTINEILGAIVIREELWMSEERTLLPIGFGFCNFELPMMQAFI